MIENLKIILYMIGFILFFLIVLSLFMPSANLIFQLGIIKKYKKVQLGVDYFRDMLTYSPSEIYYIYNKNFKNKIKDKSFEIRKFYKLIYINLLKMNLLGYIKIDFTNENNFKIYKKDVLVLDTEYKMILEYIFGKITNKNEITLYEIQLHLNENIDNEYFSIWNNLIDSKIQSRGFYIGNFINFYKDRIKRFYAITITLIVILNIILSTIYLKFGLLMILVSVILLAFGYYETKRIKVVSDSGIYEYRKMVALMKFLKDFSNIEEKGPEIIKLLDDYVVYASIFGLLKEKSALSTYFD